MKLKNEDSIYKKSALFLEKKIERIAYRKKAKVNNKYKYIRY